VKIPKGVIRSRKSTKDRQNNGQTEKYITTNNEPQKTTQKNTDCGTRIPLKIIG